MLLATQEINNFTNSMINTYGPIGGLIVLITIVWLLWYFGIVGNRSIENNNRKGNISNAINEIDFAQSLSIKDLENKSVLMEGRADTMKSLLDALEKHLNKLESKVEGHYSEFQEIKGEVKILKDLFSSIIDKLSSK